MGIDLLQKYDIWNEKKKYLSSRNTQFLFKEGEIWWCSLGLNIGAESFGKGDTFRRPVLVLKKLSRDLCVAIPLTSKQKIGSWFMEINVQDETRWLMLYQIKTIDTKRFQHRMISLSQKDFVRVKEKLEGLLELSKNHHSGESEIGGQIPKVLISIPNEEMESIECDFCAQNEPFIAEYFQRGYSA